MVKIGILNLQGAVSEHFDMTRKTVENLKLDIEVEEVRYSDDVEKCDGLIISGGESTVIGKLIKERGIDKVIKEKTEKDDLSLSVYFKNNKGLNKIERSSRLHVAYLI